MNACRHELEQITGGNFQSRRPPREHMHGFHSNHVSPAKLMRGNSGYRGSPFTNTDSYGRSGGDNFGNNNGGFGGGYRGGYNNRGYVGDPRRRGNRSGGGGGFRGRYFNN